MTEISQKKIKDASLIKEESLLNWNDLLEKFKSTFGNDIYESWLKNIIDNILGMQIH